MRRLPFTSVANTSPQTVTLPPSPRSFSGRVSVGLNFLPWNSLTGLLASLRPSMVKSGGVSFSSNLTTGAFSCKYCSNSASVRWLPVSSSRTMGSVPVRSWISSASTRGSSTLSRMVRPALTRTRMPSGPKRTGSFLSRNPFTGIPCSFSSSIIRPTASGVIHS